MRTTEIPTTPPATGTGTDAGTAAIASLGTILSLWAHPDDETYLAGGVMAAAVALGQRVVCVTASAGEHGTPDPVAWPPERLAAERRAEAVAAMAELGVREHHVLGLPDGGLDDHEDNGIAEFQRLLDEVRPDTILTFGPDGRTYHPDHIAVHRWATVAWQRTGGAGRLLYATATKEYLVRHRDLFEEWGVYMAPQRPLGIDPSALALHHRLDDTAVDRKLAALRAMPTQTAGVLAEVDHRVLRTMLAEEPFVAAVRTPA